MIGPCTATVCFVSRIYLYHLPTALVTKANEPFKTMKHRRIRLSLLYKSIIKYIFCFLISSRNENSFIFNKNVFNHMPSFFSFLIFVSVGNCIFWLWPFFFYRNSAFICVPLLGYLLFCYYKDYGLTYQKKRRINRKEIVLHSGKFIDMHVFRDLTIWITSC